MRRFFVAPELLQDDSFALLAEILQHLKVLRIPQGGRIELFDGQGRLAQGIITELDKSGGRIVIEQRSRCPAEPLSLRLIQGLPKGNKMDLVLQKGTELGITRFSPVYCRNGDVILPPGRLDGRTDRWRKIIREAARQSGRCHLPRLDEPVALESLLPRLEEELRLVPWEQAAVPLQDRLQGKPPQSASFLIGPEGGLTAPEVDLAMRNGFLAVSLGPRILRSETAGIAVASVLQYLFGDLGSGSQ